MRGTRCWRCQALHEQANGPSLVVFLLCAVWAGDIAALYAGRAWGKRKMAPKISPSKTWVGTVASMAGSRCLPRMR